MDWQNSLGLSYRKKIRKLQVVFSLKYSLTSLIISGETHERPSPRACSKIVGRCLRRRTLISNDRANTLALVHQVKRFIDALQRQRMGDHWIDLDITIEIFFHVARQL